MPDNEGNGIGEHWFAIAVVPRKEKIAAKTLRLKGYVDFLPLYSMKRKWSDRIKLVELPLFPGYLFCRFDPALRLPILKVPSVLSILGLGSTPEPIPDREIEALQTVCKAGVQALPCPYLYAGAKVRINEGPLAGVEGILVEEKETRLILSISLLQRSIAVEVESDWITPTRIYREFSS
ncbi:MAG: UpxY family transcription antiterminator [Acidobacteriota bacterium]|nr:UpxY family transcription antiterminator [Acidobacteriota bacterium]